MARRRCVWKGTVAGLAGGLVAAWVMNQFQSGWSAAASKFKESKNVNGSGKERQAEGSEDATMKAANRVAKLVLRRPLNKSEKKKAAPVVHYAFAAAMGAAYGAAVEKMPRAKTGFGLSFGTALFLGADEIAVPALGLSSQSSKEIKPGDHLYGLVSHFVYGATTELVRRGVRSYL